MRLHPQARAAVDRAYEIQGGSRARLTVGEAREATRRAIKDPGQNDLSGGRPTTAVERARFPLRRSSSSVSGPHATGPPVGDVHDIELPGRHGALAARRYQPAGEAPIGTLVFLHGGGWVLGTLDSCDALCRAITQATACTVVSLDYRLAPEAPFPAAVEDTWDALIAVAASAAGPVAVGGMSAGGNLATVACLLARDAGGPQIAYQLLIVPVCDHDLTRPSYRDNAVGLGLETGEMAWFWDHYLPSPEQRRDWRASPLRAPDLSGLPPASIVIADCDPLADEAVAYADALQRAGVDVVASRWYGMHHQFFANPAVDGGAMALAAEAHRLRHYLRPAP
jgi:acetyl esterase